MSILSGKEIVLGITGCIAAYKSVELVRQLVKHGAQVHVVMTKNACEFITPLTFQTLSGNPVTIELFNLYEEKEIGHIALAQRADIFVIAPATANSIGKVAHGIADDMLSTVVMATRAPVLFAPAMNANMWENPIVQNNIESLKGRGYHFIEPDRGDLACGVQGQGRLAETEDVLDVIMTILSPNDFNQKKVIVTAGPTRELLDPVRFLSNPSSGKMGFAIARALQQRGAYVTLISGPTALAQPRNIAYVPVQSAREMAEAVNRHFDETEIVVMSAAVADYRPKEAAAHKIKKADAALTLEFERTSDILESLSAQKANRILVGFAAETQDMLAHAQEKLHRKKLDLIVANDVSRDDAGFGTDTNAVTLIFADGATEELPTMSKAELAHKLLDRIATLTGSS